MSKHTIQQISDYTALAEASYANFARSKIDLSQQDATEIKAAIQDAIIKTDPTEKNTPLKFFANYVTDNYQIIAHYADRVENGFRIKIYEDFYENIQKISLKIKFLIPLRLKAVFQLLYFEIRMAKIKDNMCWQFVGLGVLQIW